MGKIIETKEAANTVIEHMLADADALFVLWSTLATKTEDNVPLFLDNDKVQIKK